MALGLLLSGPLVEHTGFAVTGTLFSLVGIVFTLLIAVALAPSSLGCGADGQRALDGTSRSRPRWQAMHGRVAKIAVLAMTALTPGIFVARRPGRATRRRRPRRPTAKAAASSSSRSRTTSSTGSARSDRDYTNGVRFGWLSPAITDHAGRGSWRSPRCRPSSARRQSDSVVRRVGVSIGQNIYTPNDIVHLAADLQRPALCGLALCQLRPAVHLQAARREDGHRGAGAARHAAARPRRDRSGGRRRVRAEQFPQADRRSPTPTAGPTSCTTSRRSASPSSGAGAPPARS